MSLVESLVNVAAGFGLASAANLIFLPLFGFTPSFYDVLGLGGIMTVISVVRSYTLRRTFEAIRVRRSRADGRGADCIEAHGDAPHVPDWMRIAGRDRQ